MSKFVVTAFDVGACGWYARGEDEPSAANRLGDVFKELVDWVKAREHIEETLIRVKDSRMSSPVYASDVADKDGDFLVTLWLDKSRAGNQEVLGLNVKEPPNGSSKVASKKFGTGFIPGFPVYFFVVPEADRVYSVRPGDNQVSGHKEFDGYVQSFIGAHMGDAKSSTDAEGNKTTLHRMKKNRPEGFSPRFSSKLKKNKREKHDILSRASDIRKIVSSRNLKNESAESKRDFINGLLRVFDLDITADEVGKSKFAKCFIDVELTREQVETMLDTPVRGERIGFVLKGDSKIKWADQCIDRNDIDLDVDPDVSVFDAAELLAELALHKSSLLS